MVMEMKKNKTKHEIIKYVSKLLTSSAEIVEPKATGHESAASCSQGALHM